MADRIFLAHDFGQSSGEFIIENDRMTNWLRELLLLLLLIIIIINYYCY